VTALLVTVAVVLAAGSLTLLFHPLARFLKASEVPAALLIACSGRPNRRRLLFVLRSRREAYLDDIAGLPPEYLRVVLAWQWAVARFTALVLRCRRRLRFAWRNGPLVVPPKEKKLAGGMAEFERVVAANEAAVREAGCTVAELSEAVSQVGRHVEKLSCSASARGIGASLIAAGSVTAAQVQAGDVTLFPAARNPWAAQVNAELAVRRADEAVYQANAAKDRRDAR
jgi:hypothetical protein